jgi:hypothetical protein
VLLTVLRRGYVPVLGTALVTVKSKFGLAHIAAAAATAADDVEADEEESAAGPL